MYFKLIISFFPLLFFKFSIGNEFKTDSNENDKLSFSRYKRASGFNSLGGIEEEDGEKCSKFKQEGEGPLIGGSDTKTIKENVEKEKKKGKNVKKVLYISDYLLRSPLYFHVI
ncbi:unnamed protein product [Meloidogyne enterolobii]|uniref:Uncharacterized protein n=1 Tax=Meloidogyne enterolobii TaxID=390850 RepID=A0ACB0ZG13_MELEN